MLKNPLARAPSLAQFLGIGRAAPKAAANAEEKPKDKEAEEEAAAGEGQEQAAGGEAEAAGSDEEGKPEGGTEAKEKAKGKGSAEDDAEEDEDEEDDRDREEMRGDSPVVQARVRERARCAAILTHPAAAANMPLAQQLAFGSRMGRKEACAVLAAATAGAPKGGELGTAMAGFAGLRPGAAPPSEPGGTKQIEASWDRAAAKAGVRRA